MTEGQHRLEALRQMGVTNVPVHVVKDMAAGVDETALNNAVKAAQPMHPDQRHQMIGDLFDAVHDVGSAAEVRQQYDAPQGHEKAWNAALDHLDPPPPAQPAPGFRAFHGSPHSFDAFDSSKIGTGEGAQGYGYGLYVAGNERVAKGYRDGLATPLYDGKRYNSENVAHRASYYINNLSGGSVDAALQRIDGEIAEMGVRPDAAADYVKAGIKRLKENRDFIASGKPVPEMTGGGSVYEVQVNADPAHFLDWDKPRDQLAPKVQEFAKANYPSAWDKAADGSSLYHHIVGQIQSEYPGATKGYNPPPGFNAHAIATQEMKEAGIPGIRYLDGGSRASGEGTHNHVLFDAANLAILRKYGLAGLMAGGAAAAATQAPPEQ